MFMMKCKKNALKSFIYHFIFFKYDNKSLLKGSSLMGDLFTCFQFLIIDPSAWYQGSVAFNLGSWVFELHCLTKRCQFCCFWLGWTCKQVSRVRSSAVVIHFTGCRGTGGLTHGGTEGQEGFSFPGSRQVTRSAGWAQGLQARLSVSLWLSVLLGAGTLWVSQPVWGWGPTSLAPLTPTCAFNIRVQEHFQGTQVGIRLTGTTWSVVVTVVVLLRVQTVQYSGSRAGGVHGRGGGFVREDAATRCLPCALGPADALCAFFFLLCLPGYLLLTMPVFNYSLHDLAWNQVLVTDQPGLVWSLSTVWCHPSAFNTGSWPLRVRLPFLLLHPSWIKELWHNKPEPTQNGMAYLRFTSFLKLSSCLLINSQNAPKVLSSWFQLWGINDF